jgi:subtilosin-A
MIERAEIVNNKFCSSCAIGAICLADGPVPDFEIAGIEGVMAVFG